MTFHSNCDMIYIVDCAIDQIDDIFVSRKRIESQTLKVQSELDRVIDERKKEFSKDPCMLYEFERLVDLIRNIQAEELELIQINAKIEPLKDDSQARHIQTKSRDEDLERQIEQVELDLELASMDEFDARKYLLTKVKDVDAQRKQIDKQVVALQSEIDTLVNEQSKLQTQLRLNSYTPQKESTAIELLHKSNDKQKRFLADVPEMKAQLQKDITRLTASIRTLEQEVENKRGKELQLPSRDELELMKEEVDFTSKHLSNNKNTWMLLQEQKKSREAELQKILSLEDKIAAELKDIETKTSLMNMEMLEFKSPNELQASADAERDLFIEEINEYTHKISDLDTQLTKLVADNKQKRRVLESQPNWKDVVLSKSKLQDQEKEINELQNKIDGIEGPVYDDLKANCLSLVKEINNANLAKQ